MIKLIAGLAFATWGIILQIMYTVGGDLPERVWITGCIFVVGGLILIWMPERN